MTENDATSKSRTYLEAAADLGRAFRKDPWGTLWLMKVGLMVAILAPPIQFIKWVQKHV